MKNSSQICVPVSALSLPGEKAGESTAPAMGDTVDITGTAKVTKIDGDKAYVQPLEINGQALAADKADDEEKPEDLDEAEEMLRKETGKPGAQSQEIY